MFPLKKVATIRSVAASIHRRRRLSLAQPPNLTRTTHPEVPALIKYAQHCLPGLLSPHATAVGRSREIVLHRLMAEILDQHRPISVAFGLRPDFKLNSRTSIPQVEIEIILDASGTCT
jgi:hypothetical protein